MNTLILHATGWAGLGWAGLEIADSSPNKLIRPINQALKGASFFEITAGIRPKWAGFRKESLRMRESLGVEVMTRRRNFYGNGNVMEETRSTA